MCVHVWIFCCECAFCVLLLSLLLFQARKHLTEEELDEVVRPTIDYLASLFFRSGNFPSSLGSDRDRLVQWCHGAPGAVYLFGKAYQVCIQHRTIQDIYGTIEGRVR